MLVFIADIETKAPKKYAPLSPRKILGFGKLYLRNIIIIIIAQSSKKAKSWFPVK